MGVLIPFLLRSAETPGPSHAPGLRSTEIQKFKNLGARRAHRFSGNLRGGSREAAGPHLLLLACSPRNAAISFMTRGVSRVPSVVRLGDDRNAMMAAATAWASWSSPAAAAGSDHVVLDEGRKRAATVSA